MCVISALCDSVVEGHEVDVATTLADKDDFFVISFFLLSELEYVHVLRLLNRSIIKFLLCV